ncbi:DNA primase [Serinicoccus kebangsaanensis]|uniref:DNA primase n=1 Tax=Serinicoccus kebangsaanensis TaxID=2602069 RepID=UPI00124D3866|nr:DNA primase [Serinicoccus kebangsaanensis]
MPRIKDEDVKAVKERASIEEVVREHVTLRTAGVGAMKGLCPFHDEKTPSFQIRTALGTYHCFGCGVGGDVISFLMEIDHLTFAEAVERLADKLGITLRYEDTGPGTGRGEQAPVGQRTRLMEAHRVAEEFYHEALLRSGEGRAGRDFLRDKGFTGAHAGQFMVGYAPREGTALVTHLRGRGFTEEELVLGGLANRRGRGLSDRFQGRVLWPIRAITGDTVGFGARRLFDDDWSPAKYLNTSETPIYKKTGVLYGLDLAKKPIATERTAVVVEGYTDVMAAHLSGVETAVATCGTAFGADHISILRRILRDEAGRAPARVIFTFDGDAAGQKAAMKAFEQDQRWAAQSYVAVAADGQDPNDLWIATKDAEGEERGRAVRELVEGAEPLLEFAVRSVVDQYDLSQSTQRASVLRQIVPLLAKLKDESLLTELARYADRLVGSPNTDVILMAIRRERRKPSTSRHATAPGGRGHDVHAGEDDNPAVPTLPQPDLRDPVQMAERHLVQVALQYPLAIVAEDMDELEPDALRAPMHRAVWHAMREAGGVQGAAQRSARSWVETVLAGTPPPVHPLVHELSVASLPDRLDPETAMPREAFVDWLVLRVRLAGVEQEVAELLGRQARAAEGSPDKRQLDERLMALHRERARLRARME